MMIKLATLTRMDNGRDLVVSSKIRFRASVLVEMKRLGELEQGEWYGKQLLENIEYVRALVLDGMREVAEVRKQTEEKRLQEREQDVEQVDTSAMIDLAYNTLSNLKEFAPSYNWKAVSCAVAFATGRRMTEIHHSASFELVDEYTVSFTGQAKAKGSQAEHYAINPSYNIPTLIPAVLVVKGLNWLKANGKQAPNPEKAHSGYAADLGTYIKTKWYPSTMPTMVESDKDRPTRGKHCTYHRLRQLYSLCTVDAFKPSNVNRNAYIARILGHSEGDIMTSLRYEKDLELMQGSKTSTR